jgi:hypothetical protein
MISIIFIFAVPMVIAALLISPTAFHNLIHGVPCLSHPVFGARSHRSCRPVLQLAELW